MLLPYLAGLQLDRVYQKGVRVRIEARTKAGEACCPDCGAASRLVHSRYVRRLVDAGIGVGEVTIVLTVRRLFCDQPGCARTTFAEQVPGLTRRHGRRTAPAAGVGRVCGDDTGRSSRGTLGGSARAAYESDDAAAGHPSGS